VDGRFERVNEQFERVNGRFEQVDRQFEQVDRQFARVNGRFDQVDGRFEEVNRRIDAEAHETRNHFGVIGEALREDIRAVAEGVVAATEGIARLRTEMEARARASDTVVNAAFAALRRDVDDLRARF